MPTKGKRAGDKKKPPPSNPQVEVTHLGVMINLMLEFDEDARKRILKYLNDRFFG